MKHVLKSAALFGMLFIMLTAVAQPREGGTTGNNNFMNIFMFTKQLDLTGDQVKAIKALMKAQNEEIKAVRTAGGDRAAQLKAVRAIKDATEAKILVLLTSEQWTKFNELLEKQGTGGGQLRPQTRATGGGLLGMLDRQLDLTDEQEASIMVILENGKEQIKNLEIRGSVNADKEANRAEVERIREETETAIKAWLNPDQLVTYNEILDRRNSIKDKAKTGEIKANCLKKRVEFEEVLSIEDKKKIKILRKTMQDAKAEKRAWFNYRNENSTKPSKVEMLKAGKVWKEKYAKELDAINSLVEKYDTDIQAILANTPACCKGQMGEKGMLGKKDRMKARFLLMNPKGAGEDVSKVDTEGVEISTVQVSPNPAKARTTISYNVKNEGNIKIDLIDESGNFVKNLVNEFKKEGAYQLKFNANTLQSNKIYFIAIADRLGVHNEKLLTHKK